MTLQNKICPQPIVILTQDCVDTTVRANADNK
jgi:hypothetical protein